MFGISEFSAVINPPQACILAVGGGVPRVLPPKTTGGKPRVVTTIRYCLSADRRVVDEDAAGQFIQVFSEYLGNPKSILL
jgi:pyruvate dehydrogenase E2 component (dihydrolipoamide acetyltransferase)